MIKAVHIDVCAMADDGSIHAAGWGRQLVQVAAWACNGVATVMVVAVPCFWLGLRGIIALA
jgi:hypothetical protein